MPIIRIQYTTTQVYIGLNQEVTCEKRLLLYLNYNTFVSVWIAICYEEVFQSSLPNILKWMILNYLSGCQTFVQFGDIRSQHRIIKQGDLQDEVLSPPLFDKLFKIIWTSTWHVFDVLVNYVLNIAEWYPVETVHLEHHFYKETKVIHVKEQNPFNSTRVPSVLSSDSSIMKLKPLPRLVKTLSYVLSYILPES